MNFEILVFLLLLFVLINIILQTFVVSQKSEEEAFLGSDWNWVFWGPQSWNGWPY